MINVERERKRERERERERQTDRQTDRQIERERERERERTHPTPPPCPPLRVEYSKPESSRATLLKCALGRMTARGSLLLCSVT